MNIKRIVLSLALTVFLALPAVAAETMKTPPSFPEKDIVFVAKSIDIASDYKPKGENNVDTIMKPTPAQRLQEKLADSFFVTTTGNNALKITITSASITEEHTKSDSWFKRGTFKYVASFAVRMQMLDAQGKVIANAISKSWGARTISDGVSIEERENLLSEMTDKLVADLVGQVRIEAERGFRQYLRPDKPQTEANPASKNPPKPAPNGKDKNPANPKRT